MARTIYLQTEFKSGKLFEFSKDPQEGFEPHTNTKGVISYRRYIKEGIYGIYRGTTIRDTNFGKEISIQMVSVENDNIYMSFPLFDQKKSIASYAESFIAVLPAMELNYVYRVLPYAMDNDKGYKNYGVSVKHADMHAKTVREDYPLARLTYTYDKKVGDGYVRTEGDIPAVVWETGVTGDKEKNTKEKDRYLYQVLESNASVYEKVSNKTTGGEPPKPVNGTEAPTPSNEAPQQNAPAPEPAKVTPEPIKAYEQGTPVPAPVANAKNDLPF